MNRSGVGEYHLGRSFTVSIGDTLPMLFEKFSKPRLGYAKM
jgi:hypothetical protein